MVRERRIVKGVCTGLFVGMDGKRIEGGIYPALARGECRIISIDNHNNAQEALEFANTLANTFIDVDRQWEKMAKMDKGVIV